MCVHCGTKYDTEKEEDSLHQLHEVQPPGGDDSDEVIDLHQEEPCPGGGHEAGDAGTHFSALLLLNTEAAVLQAPRQPPRSAAPTPGEQRVQISTSETSIFWALVKPIQDQCNLQKSGRPVPSQ